MKLTDIFKKKEIKGTLDNSKVFATNQRAYNFNSGVTLLNSFKNWSGICINKISNSVAGVNMYATQINSKGEEVILDSNHWLTMLLKSPNKPQGLTFNDIAKQLTQWLYCTGNAYLWMPLNGLKYPTQIWILPSSNVTPVSSSNNLISYFELQTPQGRIDLPTNEVCHIKTLMPSLDWSKNYIIGTPVSLLNAIDSIQADYEMKDFIKKHFEQEALSPIIIKGNFDSQEQVDLEKSKIRRSGVKSSIVGAVGSDVTFETFPTTSIGTNTVNSQVNSNINAIMISSAFGVPYGMLDTTSQQNVATAEINYRTYRLETIEPLIMLIENYLNLHFSQFESNLILKHDVYQYVDKQNELEILKLVVSASSLTINELRESYGLAAIPEGDVLINSIAEVPMTLPSPTKELKKKV